VGGSFDILAGHTRRAPIWCQEHGLEWLYRAYQEPVRLGRRYLTTNLSFMALVGREKLRRDKAGPGQASRAQASRAQASRDKAGRDKAGQDQAGERA
jgi:N-acetylglucosaminyldiphosphoundecaprenol N-acetyl-beta-D-mannosaminyltransferase